jgi:hypothetical protein
MATKCLTQTKASLMAKAINPYLQAQRLLQQPPPQVRQPSLGWHNNRRTIKMMWFLIGLSAGACLGLVAAGLLASSRMDKLREERDQHASAAEELWLLRARIRAVQDRGVTKGKEVVYTIQQPNGRFGKFTLPRV